ncbi:MAG: sulfite exporter TauE/SafE family protein [Amphritea sp.]|nr:sulfite exporter TauE/SafE family protein [Amphritea sp.]MBQ0785577.1 sulfite exporter TauE/SafE family protein [Amphritea sp.]
MTEGWEFWSIAVIGVLITGISKSGFAGGIGVITVPLLALQIGPLRAAALMLPLLIIMDILSVRAWWGKQVKALLWLLLPPAAVGIGIGYLLFDYLNDQILRMILGWMSILFGLWGLLKGMKLGRFTSPWVGRVCGGVAGFTSFLAHAGGPPLNFYLIPQQLPREKFLATAVLFLASINLMKLVPYIALGQINSDNLVIGIVLAPIAWLGVKLGLKIQHLLNDVLFYRIILVLLMLVGIKLITDAI